MTTPDQVNPTSIKLTGKVGLVIGIANNQSIAYGCAKAMRALGAELAESRRMRDQQCRAALDSSLFSRRKTMFKMEIEDAYGLWSDVRGSDGAVLTFEHETEARAKLAEFYPVMVKVDKYCGNKHTRVVRVFRTDQEWQDGTPPP